MIKRILAHSFSLLNVDRVKLNSKWNYDNVISPYHRLYFINDGEGEISDMFSTFKLEAGYLYIIPSFTWCKLRCDKFLEQYFIQFFEDSAEGFSLFYNNRSIFKIAATPLDVDLFNRLLKINPGRGLNRSDNPKFYEKNVFYNEYQQLNNNQSVDFYMETQGIILQLVSRFLKIDSLKRNNWSQVPEMILDSLNYISINLNQELSVALLAQRVNKNSDYFSRIFEKVTGERPLAFINGKRIERAQLLLVTTNKSYLEISVQTGFKYLSYFSSTFKKLTGMAPAAYKKQGLLINY